MLEPTRTLHPAFPEVVRLVVEQPREFPYRLRYNDVERKFVRTAVRSMLLDRNFPGVYGWVDGLGHPPGSHCDLFLLTDLRFEPGDLVDAHVCGIFFRSDLDHKVFALDEAHFRAVRKCDFFSLPSGLRQSIERLYPEPREGDRWAGADEARAHLEAIYLKLVVPNAD